MFGTCIAVLDGYSRSAKECFRLAFKNNKTIPFYKVTVWSIILGSMAIIFQFGSSIKNLVDLATTISFMIAPFIAFANYKLVSKSYLKEENIIEYDEKYIHTWPLHPYQYLAEIIKKRKWGNLNIGLEMDSHYFTAFCYETIKKGLPNAKLKDAERLVNWVRVVKSNAEIKLMQSAARIVESGMKTAYKSINPGVRQCDAVADIPVSYTHLTLPTKA